MPTALSNRFAGRISWITFLNNSAETIPPFSVVMAQGWTYPDLEEIDDEVVSPILGVTQPNGSVAPYDHYLTDAVAVRPGGYGRCARPQTIPLLGSLAGASEDGNDNSFRLVGPVPGSFQLARDMPGFVMLDEVQTGLCPVQHARGPYRGQLVGDLSHEGIGPLYTLTGSKGSEQPTSQTVLVYNPYSSLKAGVRATYDWVDNGWELIAADPCPPSQ